MKNQQIDDIIFFLQKNTLSDLKKAQLLLAAMIIANQAKKPK